MKDSIEFKTAAINWLLTHGTCDSMTTSTRLALADLAVRGVDYVDSETPDFRTATLDPGDTFHEATTGKAFAATIYPLNRDKNDWREGYEFRIGEDEIQSLLVSQMILGVLAATDAGDAEWKARADQREIAHRQRTQEAADLLTLRKQGQQQK